MKEFRVKVLLVNKNMCKGVCVEVACGEESCVERL